MKAWWQGLFQFLGLFFVGHHQCVQKAGATNLEFGIQWILLDFDGTGILSACLNEKILDFFNLFRHLMRIDEIHILLLPIQVYMELYTDSGTYFDLFIGKFINFSARELVARFLDVYTFGKERNIAKYGGLCASG